MQHYFWKLTLLLLSSCAMIASGCTTYRLQYEEEFSLVKANGSSAPKEKFGPFRYLYEESFAKSTWFSVSCAVTFFYYGGACWLYLLSSDEDKATLQTRSQQKLDQLIGSGMQKVGATYDIWNARHVNRDLPPRLRIFDPSGVTVLQGEAHKINGVPKGFWAKTSDNAWDPNSETLNPVKGQVMVDAADRNEYDEKFTYQAFHLSYLAGQAQVRSDIKEYGLTSTIASGSVDLKIYEFRTRVLPPNGWFWSYSPTFRSQKLTIKDFDSRLRLYESSDAYDIPVVISDPATQQVTTQYVNEYGVGLRSYGVFLGGGYGRHFKLKTDRNFWSFNASVWVSAVDYLQTEVRFQDRSIDKDYFAFLKSYRGDLDIFYNILPARLALGLHWQYSFYPDVQMPDDMEFRGPARYNQDKRVFERPRLLIDSLDFSSRVFGLSLSYIYEDLSFR